MSTITDLEQDLDDHMFGDAFAALDPDHDQPPTFAADDLDAVDRMLGRIARLETRLTELDALAELRKKQIREWFDGQAETIIRQRDFWVRSVEGWMRSQHDEGGPKTHKLPAGTLSLRKPTPRLDAAGDPDPRWSRSTWDKAAAKKATEIGPVLDDQTDTPDGFVAYAAIDPGTGEIVPNLTYLVAAQPSFSYKTGDR